MAIVSFKYYLYDNREHDELVESIARQTGLDRDDPVFEKIGRPFYEVTFDCTLDTDTGNVEILSTTP